MISATNQIVMDALRLPPIEKANLIEKLFYSFDIPYKNNNIDALWADEIESRIDAYDNGIISADTEEAVLARMKQR
jgi:putative addiction module component (TIGR02574 family)